MAELMKPKIFILLYFLLFLLSGKGLHAQNNRVSGIVTSEEDGLSLPGVSVSVKGTSSGVTTDAKGFYTINVQADQTLLFSFIGFKSHETKVDLSKNTIDIVMHLEAKELNEVVVIGYGSKKRTDLIGSVSTVKSSEMVARPSSDIQNASSRCIQTLNGKWNYIVDPYEMGYYDYRSVPYDEYPKPADGAYYTNTKPKDKSDRIEYDFDKSPTLLVPRDWNSQKENLFYYEGTVWYKKSFDYRKTGDSKRLFVYIGAANYRSDVYLNGKKLGFHKGGFTPFNFEITDLVKEKDNFLIMKVDNKRKADEVPTLNTDWWNYGGITRDVQLIETPATFIRDYFIQLKKSSTDNLGGYVQLDGNNKAGISVEISVPELKVKKNVVTDSNGCALIDFKVTGIRRWSTNDPFLYDINISTTEDKTTDRIGFRTIETSGTDILLNGKPLFLKGVSIHEENAIRGGRASSREDALMLLNWAKELGCNFVRLAHYPHNENIIRLADEMGILVWEENPVYWTIQWKNPETFATASSQLKEVISRDKNRAAVIIWSMANETPVSDERMSFLKRLADTARHFDNTRLISAALEQHATKENEMVRVITDPFAEYVDVVSFNQYIGWYDGLPDKCSKITWKIDINKPVIISELGADALGGMHGDSLTRWSEEYQQYFYEQNLKMISKIPQLRGTTPWILVDFRSPRRVLPGIQDGWNRKGLISETGNKKLAFYTLKKFYEQISLKYE
jgi:beta-glucuronidase